VPMVMGHEAAGVVRDIVCMGPPFVIEEIDVDRMAETLLECVDTVTA